MNIIVNGVNKLVGDDTSHMPMGDPKGTPKHLDYGSIVQLAGYTADRVLSVTYTTRRKGDEQRSGSLTKDKTVLIEEGMIFNVADTSNA